MAEAKEYEIVGPVKARIVTIETKAQGFPDHHLTAKPGWYIVELPVDAGRYNPTYSGYPLEIVLPPETFHENFTEKKASKSSSSKATK
jgi:hypothetical protein